MHKPLDLIPSTENNIEKIDGKFVEYILSDTDKGLVYMNDP